MSKLKQKRRMNCNDNEEFSEMRIGRYIIVRWGKITKNLIFMKDFSRSGFLKLGIIGIVNWIILCEVTDLCI